MLETKIDQLTKAVEQLTRAILERDINELAKNLIAQGATVEELAQPEPTQTKVEPQPEPEQQSALTHSDLQDLILSKVRTKPELKNKVKELLAELGAKKVSDLNDTNLAVMFDKVNAL